MALAVALATEPTPNDSMLKLVKSFTITDEPVYLRH